MIQEENKGPRGKQLASIVIVVLAFVMVMIQAWRSGMFQSPGYWAVDALPVAIATDYYGHTVPYTRLEVVSDFFYSKLGANPPEARILNPILIKLVEDRNQTEVDRSKYRVLAPDDKGIVDFIRLSFALFGVRVESLTWTYFLLMGLSLGCFIAANKDSTAALFPVTIMLLALCLMIPTIAYHPQLGSLLALRVIPILTMVATYHCLNCCLFGTHGNSRIHILLLVFQVSLIVFALHIRTTTLWQIGLILMVGAMQLIRSGAIWFFSQKADHGEPSPVTGRMNAPHRQAMPSAHVAAMITLLVVASLGMLQSFRWMVYPPDYQQGAATVTRPFWHSIYSGFAFSPEMAARYALRIDDLSIVDATDRFLLDEKRFAEHEAVFPNGRHEEIRWGDYDKAVKSMVFSHLQRHPGEILAATLYYKPVSILGHLAWSWGLTRLPPDLDLFCSNEKYPGDVVKLQVVELSNRLAHDRWRGLRNPVVWALVLLSGWVMLRGRAASALGKNALVLLILLGGSLIPCLLGYPSAHTTSEAFVCVTAALFLVATTAIVRICSLFSSSVLPKLAPGRP